MLSQAYIQQSLKSALPIMLGYAGIGIPCGILCASVGLNALQVALFSLLFYSGAGQFMVPNMWLTGAPIASIIASVSLVNTRQMLYSASLAQFCQNTAKRRAFLFAATVTDESFGVNVARFSEGEWSVERAILVNLFSQSSWIISSVIGVFLGELFNIPLPLASFAMTSIFICLLCIQNLNKDNLLAMAVAFVVVFLCKWLGLAGLAILVGALAGVAVALVKTKLSHT